jgi:hypothetical protein
MRLILTAILLAACGEPVDGWIAPAPLDPGTLDPPSSPVVFLCCAGDVECAQGECTPAGYCPVACDITDPGACGDPDWATCAEVPDYVTPICVAVDVVCDPAEA